METQIENLVNMSSPVLLALVINLMVFALKKWKAFPDAQLPLAAMLLGAIGYAGLEGVNPRNLILGMAIGGLAVAFNQQLRQWVEKDKQEEGEKPIAPIKLLILAFIPLAMTGCVSKESKTAEVQRYQTSYVIVPAESVDKFGREFPQEVRVITQPIPNR